MKSMSQLISTMLFVLSIAAPCPKHRKSALRLPVGSGQLNNPMSSSPRNRPHATRKPAIRGYSGTFDKAAANPYSPGWIPSAIPAVAGDGHARDIVETPCGFHASLTAALDGHGRRRAAVGHRNRETVLLSSAKAIMPASAIRVTTKVDDQ
jgi:hypothetical protein